MTEPVHPRFARYIGIDYSGAQTPTSGLRGLRIFIAIGDDAPVEVIPPPGPKLHWTRRGVAEWLVEELNEKIPTLVGIDHSFSFPAQYFEKHELVQNWDAFLLDFVTHWPTDGDQIFVDLFRDGMDFPPSVRTGDPHWRRLAEIRSVSAKSVFHFDVPGSVAKSSHAGIPWLRFIRTKTEGRVHFWPFDGWDLPAGRSALVEIYPALCRAYRPRGEYTMDQADAYSAARWMQETDRTGMLDTYLSPVVNKEERVVAEFEGWILGVR
jgi:hypothetical protein